MTLVGKIENDLRKNLKAKKTLAVSVLRFLLAEIRDEEARLKRALKDEEVQNILRRQVKKRRESISAFRQGDREELARKEEGEIKLLSKYLPQQLNQKDLSKIVNEAIKEAGSPSPADFGLVMKTVMARVKGQADGAQVAGMVKKALGR